MAQGAITQGLQPVPDAEPSLDSVYPSGMTVHLLGAAGPVPCTPVPPDPTRDAATARAGIVLEPVVAAIEGALMALRACEAIAPDARREAEAALTAAHGRLIQQWFGDNRGQDSLFDDPAFG